MSGAGGQRPSPGESKIKIGRGSLGGRFVSFGTAPELRPTPSRAREAIFSMLAAVCGSHGFLDLCAGSGIMGFEAYSMGFRPLLWLDTSAPAIIDLKRNGAALGVKGKFLRQNALYLNRLKLETRPWVAYADPPYRDRGFHANMLSLLASMPEIETGSWYVAEQEIEEAPPAPGFHCMARRKYGRAHILIWEKRMGDHRAGPAK